MEKRVVKRVTMKLVFVSNYINHHQLPIAEELYKELGDQYAFIQMEPMEEERVKMGWGKDFTSLPFLQLYYKDPLKCQNLIDEADVLIMGSEKNPPYITTRLQKKKIVLRYTERIYKEGQWKCLSPKGFVHKYQDHIRYRKDPLYLLCAGAYVASDFSLLHAYPNKKYNWGYFPETIFYDKENLFQKKAHKKVRILWAGRFLAWKHPEYAIELAHHLKNDGIDFELNVVGDGELRTKLEEKITEYEITDCVKLLGYMKPEEVRNLMEETNIYIFTSDNNEGWGAVLNEAMNAGCAVVANCAIGSAPTLMKHKENGMIYKNGDFKEFENQVRFLIAHPEIQQGMGEKAYETITKEWNHQIVAKRLLDFCNKISHGDLPSFQTGPLSVSKAIKPKKMYQYMKREFEK